MIICKGMLKSTKLTTFWGKVAAIFTKVATILDFQMSTYLDLKNASKQFYLGAITMLLLQL